MGLGKKRGEVSFNSYNSIFIFIILSLITIINTNNVSAACTSYGCDGSSSEDYFCGNGNAGVCCDASDGWVETGNTRSIDGGICTNQNQKEEQHRNYYCQDQGCGVWNPTTACQYIVNDTRWVNTTTSSVATGIDTYSDCTFTTNNGLCTGDNCNGAGACQFNSGGTCRNSAGVCDIAEVCSGSSGSCPIDSFQPTSTLCNAVNQCSSAGDNGYNNGLLAYASGYCDGANNCDFGGNVQNPDTGSAACSCNLKTWSQGGESSAFGEYDSGTSTECCGDDGSEFFTSLGIGDDKCCNTVNDCVDSNGACQSGTESIASGTCSNFGVDDDCDGECNYDDFGGCSKGDNGCPVAVTAIAVTRMSACAQSKINISCTSSVASVSSVSASLNDAACTYVKWSESDPFTAIFNCTVSGSGTQEAKCFINTTKSYQSGTNQTVSITVGGANCCTPVGSASCSGDIRRVCNADYNWDTVEDCSLKLSEDLMTPKQNFLIGSWSVNYTTCSLVDATTTKCLNQTPGDMCVAGTDVIRECFASTTIIGWSVGNCTLMYGGAGYCSAGRYYNETWGCEGNPAFGNPSFCSDTARSDVYNGTNLDGDAWDKECGDFMCDGAAGINDSMQSDEICTDDLDNNCDGMCDYDSSSCSHGDSACPVAMNSMAVSTLSICSGHRLNVTCVSSVSNGIYNLNSVDATLNGESCNYVDGSGTNVNFSCLASGNSVQNVVCSINASKSYQSGENRTIAVSVYASESQAVCTNGLDDDCDGAIDMADSDCYGSISGIIFEAETDGLLKDANISISPPGLSSLYYASTLSNFAGQFNIVKAIIGTYNILIRKDGYVDQVVSVTVISGQTTNMNFSMAQGMNCNVDCTDNRGLCNSGCDGFVNSSGASCSFISPSCNGRAKDTILRTNDGASQFETVCCEGPVNTHNLISDVRPTCPSGLSQIVQSTPVLFNGIRVIQKTVMCRQSS